MPNYCLPRDVATRLLVSHPRWLVAPTFKVEGNEDEFGEIILDFPGEHPMDTHKFISWRIFIRNKAEIESAVAEAIANFPQLAQEITEAW